MAGQHVLRFAQLNGELSCGEFAGCITWNAKINLNIGITEYVL
jgi:hypothetical protein